MTRTEQKIKVLKDEIEEAKKNIFSLDETIKKQTQELIRSEIGLKDGENRLEILKTKMEAKKDMIPDFSEELCKLYFDYKEAKDEYEQDLKWHNECIEGYEKKTGHLDQAINHRKYYEERIEFLNRVLEETEAE